MPPRARCRAARPRATRGSRPAVRGQQQRGHAGQEHQHDDARLGQLEVARAAIAARVGAARRRRSSRRSPRRANARSVASDEQRRTALVAGREVSGGEPDGHAEQHVEHSQDDLQDDERRRDQRRPRGMRGSAALPRRERHAERRSAGSSVGAEAVRHLQPDQALERREPARPWQPGQSGHARPAWFVLTSPPSSDLDERRHAPRARARPARPSGPRAAASAGRSASRCARSASASSAAKNSSASARCQRHHRRTAAASTP